MEHTGSVEAVAAKVAEEIDKAGVTVVWLCEKTGIPRSTLNRRLRGYPSFNLNELERIAEALRIPTGVLVEPISLGAAS